MSKSEKSKPIELTVKSRLLKESSWLKVGDNFAEKSLCPHGPFSEYCSTRGEEISTILSPTGIRKIPKGRNSTSYDDVFNFCPKTKRVFFFILL